MLPCLSRRRQRQPQLAADCMTARQSQRVLVLPPRLGGRAKCVCAVAMALALCACLHCRLAGSTHTPHAVRTARASAARFRARCDACASGCGMGPPPCWKLKSWAQTVRPCPYAKNRSPNSPEEQRSSAGHRSYLHWSMLDGRCTRMALFRSVFPTRPTPNYWYSTLPLQRMEKRGQGQCGSCWRQIRPRAAARTRSARDRVSRL